MSNASNVENPYKRQELYEYLRELSEPDQQASWILDDFPEDSFGIDSVYHFFFDDTNLGSSAYSQIGYILRNNLEAMKIEKLCKELDSIVDRIGDESSRIFVEDGQWRNVIRCAQEALEAMTSP